MLEPLSHKGKLPTCRHGLRSLEVEGILAPNWRLRWLPEGGIQGALGASRVLLQNSDRLSGRPHGTADRCIRQAPEGRSSHRLPYVEGALGVGLQGAAGRLDRISSVPR